MTEKNCFGYGYYRANKLTPEQFVPPKTETELLQDFLSVNCFEAAQAIAYIYLASSEFRPDRRRFVAEHMVWIECDRRTISHRPDTDLEIAHFAVSRLEEVFPDYYQSDEYRVQYLAL